MTFYFEKKGKVLAMVNDMPALVVDEGYKRLSESIGRSKFKEQIRKEIRPYFEKAQPYHNKPLIYGLIRKITAGGMARYIDFYVIKNSELVCLTYPFEVLVGQRTKLVTNGMYVKGAGVDMVAHVVSSICYSLGIDFNTVETRHI